MSKDAIKKIVKDRPCAELLPDWLHECLFRVEQIQQQRNNVLVQISKEDDKYLKALQDLRCTMQAVQSNCPHWDQTYHGDPAGGSDSHTICNICGKQW